MKVKIIDSIPGSGKTSAIIDMIKNDKSDDNYIYITPFLTEVERVKTNCKYKKFHEPKFNGNGTKFQNLNKLISENKNIVSTHALFHKSNMATVDLIKSGDYILVLDEVFNVIEEYPISKNDIEMMINEGLAYIEDDFFLWNEERIDYNGEFNNIKYLALNRSLIMYKEKILIWSFPVEVFKAFKEVYILTYMFDCQEQCYYYKMHDIDFEYYYAAKLNDKFILKQRDDNYSEKEIKDKLNSLITIVHDKKLNAIGDNTYALSHSWYHNEMELGGLTTLKNNLLNFFINKTKSKSNEVLWTTFKDARTRLKGKGFTKGFISCSIRATNDYADRIYLAYCINVFSNPIIKQFFHSRGVKINQEKYALSELIQWIWRSAIRNDNHITIYIPSKRMRELLIDWLDDEIK